jgi:hypothetical protein
MLPFPPFNLHCHTHFSFNANGYSPTDLVKMAKEKNWYAVGIVDFDVLDGVDEFLSACEALEMRGMASLETRVYVPEFATREINSPGEPGVFYFMGVGFTRSDPAPEVADTLAAMRRRAAARNRQMIERLNAHLSPLTVDYDRDVLSLTPAGNATERHMLKAYIQKAYIQKAEEQFQPQSIQRNTKENFVPFESFVVRLNDFWAEKLGLAEDQIATQIADYAKFSNTVRGKLMKRGGVGYIPPTPETFPTVEEVSQFAIACGAIPCATWLDGTSAGEQAEAELLDLLISKGTAAINIIPDRNWNIADLEQRKLKVQKLYEVAALAQRLDLPIIVGTEMNAPGQKLVDDFEAPELAPVRQAFLDGADFLYGHTVMQRALGMGYQSEWAKTNLPTRRQRNDFYTQLGRRLQPGQASLEKLRFLQPISPTGMLENI